MTSSSPLPSHPLRLAASRRADPHRSTTTEPPPLGLPPRVRRRRLFRASTPPAPSRQPIIPARDVPAPAQGVAVWSGPVIPALPGLTAPSATAAAFISNLRYLSPLFSRRSKRIISGDEVGSQPCRCCWAMGRRPSHHCTRASPLFLLTQITAGAGCESLPLPSRFADPMRQCLTLALQIKKLEKALHLVLEGTLLCAASHSPKFSGVPYSIWQIFRRRIFLLL
jgi:hypothetical protein